MKHHFEALGDQEKLRLLQGKSSLRTWKSLAETRRCVLCERTISGEEIRVEWDRHGVAQLKCPTPGCNSTPEEWIHPGNPLISEEAWRDWSRLLERPDLEACGPPCRKPTRSRRVAAFSGVPL